MSTHSLQQQFSDWFDLYADALYRHAYFRVRDSHRAADLMQDTFTRAWSYAARGNEIREPRAFLYKVLNNLLVNEYERRKPVSSLDEMDEESGYEPETNSEEDAVKAAYDVRRLLNRLAQENETYRQVLVMRYIDELGVSEIADILDEAENTTSVRIHRALTKMKELLHEEDTNSYDT